MKCQRLYQSGKLFAHMGPIPTLLIELGYANATACRRRRAALERRAKPST
jgi:hypothetical protein